MKLGHMGCFIMVLLAIVGGCQTSNRSTAVSPIVRLPSGDEVVATTSATYNALTGRTANTPVQVLWNKPGQAPKVMHVPDTSRGPGYISSAVIERAQVHANKDCSRIWLVDGGLPVASFDYRTGTAIFGEAAQPDWVKAAMGTEAAKER